MFFVRASSLPDLLDCPARWEARNVQKIRQPSGPASVLGTAVHAGTALFDASRLYGAPLSIDDTAGVVVREIRNPRDDVDWEDTSPDEIEPVALALHRLYCTEISPNFEFVEVELKCKNLVVADLDITLTGTTDRVFRDEFGDLAIADIKTSKSIVSASGKMYCSKYAPQIAVYELLAAATLGEPVTGTARIFGLQAGKTGRGQRAGIGEINGARKMLVGDEFSPGLLNIAVNVLKSGLFWGNPNSMMCSKTYCPVWERCKWRI